MANKSLNRIKDEERKSRAVSMLSSPSIMMSSSGSSSSLTESFMAEMKLKVQESIEKPPEIIDVNTVFDKLKEDKEDADVQDNKENLSSEDEKQGNLKKVINFPPVTKFQLDLDWSQIEAATVRNLKESNANLRTTIDELNKAK